MSETVHATGYMLEVDYADRVLTARGTNAASRAALAGGYRTADALAAAGPPADRHDLAAGIAAAKVARAADLVLRREEIADVELRPAGALTNGNLIVTGVDGRRYQLHYRRKSAAAFGALHAALLADA